MARQLRQAGLVAKLRYVWFWPNGGPRDGVWGETSPAVDAFARTSRRVTERYSETLSGFKIETPRSLIQMHVLDASHDVSRVEVQMTVLSNRDEIVHAIVPTKVIRLSPQERARLVLQCVHMGMQQIGQRYSWPPEALVHAYEHTLAHNLGFEAKGQWKSNTRTIKRTRLVRDGLRTTAGETWPLRLPMDRRARVWDTRRQCEAPSILFPSSSDPWVSCDGLAQIRSSARTAGRHEWAEAGWPSSASISRICALGRRRAAGFPRTLLSRLSSAIPKRDLHRELRDASGS